MDTLAFPAASTIAAPAEPGVETLPAVPAGVAAVRPTKILVVDIGGTKIKILASGETEPRKASSGKSLTPTKMAEKVKELAAGWSYDGVSIGYPGLVGIHGPALGAGKSRARLGRFQLRRRLRSTGADHQRRGHASALGSYEGGRMLFLGLGTGLGSALIAENAILPLELGQLPHKSGRNAGSRAGTEGIRFTRQGSLDRSGPGSPGVSHAGVQRRLRRTRRRQRQETERA